MSLVGTITWYRLPTNLGREEQGGRASLVYRHVYASLKKEPQQVAYVIFSLPNPPSAVRPRTRPFPCLVSARHAGSQERKRYRTDQHDLPLPKGSARLHPRWGGEGGERSSRRRRSHRTRAHVTWPPPWISVRCGNVTDPRRSKVSYQPWYSALRLGVRPLGHQGSRLGTGGGITGAVSSCEDDEHLVVLGFECQRKTP